MSAPGAADPAARPDRVAAAVVIAAAVAVRCAALRSDPYGRLDWSAGLLTDEGFYTHNARNVALYGFARTDEFNNMLLSPVLHAVQVAVFRIAGVGSLQARSISVACSLLMIALLWDALRRTYGGRVAGVACVIAALDHTGALYHRMALMDTPAALGAVAAYWAFVRSRGAEPGSRGDAGWRALAGFVLAVTVVSRTLCVFLLPVAALALLAERAEPYRMRRALAAALPMAAVFGAWFALWYLPHRSEIARMTRFYRVYQIQPQSARELAHNLTQAVVGDNRGMMPYVFRHTPAVTALALLGCLGAGAGRLARRRRGPAPAPMRPETVWIAAWLVCGAVWLGAISYSPSRYYVSTYPALAAVAALALVRPDAWLRPLRSRCPVARTVGAIAVGLLAFHALGTLVHHRGSMPGGMRGLVLLGLPAAAAAAAWIAPRNRGDAPATAAAGAPSWLAPCAAAVWLAFNGYWMGDWVRTMRWTQFETSQRLGRMLPPGGVVIGDIAPGLCMDNRLVAVNVIPQLCNDRDPVAQFAGRPRVVAILDGRWKEQYWLRRHPDAVDPRRRVLSTWVIRWPIGVYAVDGDGAAAEAGPRRSTGRNRPPFWSNHAKRS